MSKNNLKSVVSKRQLYRRIAAIVNQINHETKIESTTPYDLGQPSTSQCVEQDLCPPSLDNFEVIHDFQSTDISTLASSDSEEHDLPERSGIENSTYAESLGLELQSWATSFKITHIALKRLLHILHPYHPYLPYDSRTLLHTPLNFPVKQLESGQYIHLGLEASLKHFIDKNEHWQGDTLFVSFNIDGLPLYKSTNIQCWPILGLIKNLPHQSPFAVGVFCGKSKPCPLPVYLDRFIEECNFLKNGFLHKSKRYNFCIHSFVCDAPARAYIKCIKPPTGYSFCEKCVAPGEYVSGRVILRDLCAAKRTNESFRRQLDEDHHLGLSPLLALDIDMVKQFPIDYMHNVCLGVMRKLLNYWVGGNLNIRLGSTSVLRISNTLACFKDYIPVEITRKPRPLSELQRYKATEFRTFLLYTGIVALKDILPCQIYNHFLLFHSAIYLMVVSDRDENTEINSELASKLLLTFIKQGGRLYGREFYIYNVHVLSHLSDDFLHYGALDNFSAFPFENYLGHMKSLVKSTTKPLQQICRRLQELNHTCIEINNKSNLPRVEIEHVNGPCLTNNFEKQYKKPS
ncbi:unnamed protein product [Callosobruchus maculatus]|uniref:Transposase domain-containing protein n=1 Tax=Callosobruchus maculatus TaxID=64391 RepID=A0A653DA17_CALMS|nr:unnamed protein product [Callosobruchus maculatus]